TLPFDTCTDITVQLPQCTGLREIASVTNADRSRYAAFASERGCVLKNRAFLDDKSSDSREQRCKMRMEDPHNKNSTCRNAHNVFGVADNIRLPAGTSGRGAQARVDFR